MTQSHDDKKDKKTDDGRPKQDQSKEPWNDWGSDENLRKEHPRDDVEER